MKGATPERVEIGLVADTHVPDRQRVLPLAAIQTALAGVAQVWHLGDVVTPGVLAALESIAPVLAVRGNRDIWHSVMRRLPAERTQAVLGWTVGITHGHGGWWGYWHEKWAMAQDGYVAARYMQRVKARFAVAPDVIVFGHSHRALIATDGPTLYFNPGPVGPDYHGSQGAVVGRMVFDERWANLRILPLDGGVGESYTFERAGGVWQPVGAMVEFARY